MTKTLGMTFGHALGSSAAHTGHFVALTATGIARFAGDTGKGAVMGYAQTSAIRLAQRQARAAARQAAGQPEMPIGILVTA
jgi:hypothetical protein